MSEWKNLCDYNPKAGDFIEVIGPLINHTDEFGLYWNKLRKKPIRIGRHVRMYNSEFYYDVLSEDYCNLKMIGPMQYRKITDYKIIREYKPLPKFDWSYC